MKLKITQDAWQKILAFTDICPDEISGLGKVFVKDGDMTVSDVAIFRQQVSGSHSTIEPKALAEFQTERIKKGESMKDWTLWWHSHAQMSVFFSGTDTGTIDSSTEFPYMVSLVVNKKHEKLARVDLFRPFRFTQDNLPIEIIESSNEKIKALCEKEIQKKVTRPVYESKKEPIGYTSSLPGFSRPYKSVKDVLYPNIPSREVEDESWRPRTVVLKEMEDAQQEYLEHRRFLLTQIARAKKHKQRVEISKLQRQLSEWDSYARDMGLTIKGN